MKNLFFAFLAIVAVSCNSSAQKNKSEANSKKDVAATFEVSKTDAEWKGILTPAQYHILREAGTERPFSSELNDIKKPGTFVCAADGTELYKTAHKFDSGTGWPSFDRAIEGGIAMGSDAKLGYSRDEIHCATCGGHLGHLFNDGPQGTTGKRHCINGDAMKFIPETK
ncbi:peptide-methionine (R)-S-oxide reductase [Gillisia sp. Hel_I_86]|uniref:peptide-methionine (R)-S-oxide reductase MsrB n=1 Tax=Gillisia sp. Hel_I_86 TaxID=1249981 RepID=UPI00119C7ABC|nr:peptide-methionine (R)-S-oxide reductase MsrB [Gillisia sp. Hel_I_86]TVZ27978.1 peptide-methionine (R)-S-oxide reductase [Gillisia sp. Hel_I_86]